MALTRIKSSNVVVTPTGNVSSVNAQSALAEIDAEKQVALVSGANIKTVGGVSLLGSGDIPSTQIGTGGQTTTGNVTLTSTSQSAITATPTTPGLYVTLPDATTCIKGTARYCVYNAGDYDYGVMDSAGTQLGWVRARTGAMIGLSDSSTAAGVWAYYGLEKTAITAQLALPSVANSVMQNSRTVGPVIVTLDATRTCFIFGSTTCYAVIYDSSTQSWGSVTTVRATITNAMFTGVLSATNQVLIASANGATVQAVTLTISGTAITVNTAVALGSSATWQGVTPVLVQVGASFVCAYSRSGMTQEAFAITVSGTVPTLGAAVSDTSAGTGGNGFIRAYVSGAVIRLVTSDASAGMWCVPMTVSGTTLTIGTSAGTGATLATNTSKVLINGGGNIVALYVPTGSTAYAFSIFKLTGTSEAITSVGFGSGSGAVVNDVLNMVELVNIGTNKTLVIAYDNTSHRVNILTDTSGTASLGTALSLAAIISQAAAAHAISVSGTTAKCLVSCAYATGGQGSLTIYDVDCSGVSPVVSAIKSQSGFYVSGTTPTLGCAQIGSSDHKGQRHTGVLKAGSSAYFIAGPCAAFDWRITANSIQKIQSLPIANSTTLGQYSIITGVIGAAANESWVYAALGLGSNQVTIQRIEAAQ
jgi:hypothetical protein